MAAQTFSQLRTRLDTSLSDSANKTFSTGEKDEFMTRAFNDPVVYKLIRDTSLTTTSTTATYTLPSTVTEPTDVGIDTTGDGFRITWLDRDSYDIIDGKLIFQSVQYPLMNGKTIYLYGKYKLTVSDSVPDFLQEYVLTLAEIEAFSFMKNKYATRFLKNDVTMAELLNGITERKQHAQELRKSLANRREIAG